MPASTEKLTAKQQKALGALLAHPSIQAAADALGMNECTIRRWLRERHFSKAYLAARRQAVSQATARLTTACVAAVEALEGIAKETTLPASARVSAARAILETALRGVEVEDLAARVDAIEQTLQQQERGDK